MEDNTPVLERPLVRASLVFMALVVAQLLLGFFLPVEKRYSTNLTDSLLCLGGLAVWGVFFAQFILPVQTLRERWAVIWRSLLYYLGRHGAAVFIENGNIRSRGEETKRTGAGLLWLDSASAAMLRTNTNYTRTLGPGLHFTKKGEFIAATTHLFPSILTFGPADSENPFTVPADDPKYEEIQRRHWETRALTRDAIEVGASIAVIFRIRAEASEADKQRGKNTIGKSRFGYDAENVTCYLRESIAQGVRVDQPVWSPLPAQMAVDVWREYLTRFKLDQLFSVKDEKVNPDGRRTVSTYLQFIAEMVKKRLTEPSVPCLNDFGEPTGDVMPSPEYDRLTRMGLKVVNVNLRRVIFKPEIEEKFISQWTTLWLKNAQKEREFIEKAQSLRSQQGRQDALVTFADISTKDLAKQPRLPRNKEEALYHLVRSTTREVISTYVKQMGKPAIDTLTDIRRWLEEKIQR